MVLIYEIQALTLTTLRTRKWYLPYPRYPFLFYFPCSTFR